MTIKKIPVVRLRPGMFVSDFNADWLDHPFFLNQKLIRSDEEIERISAAGIDLVYIDTARGTDADDMPTAEEAADQIEQALTRAFADETAQIQPVGDGLQETNRLIGNARRAVRELFTGVRLGNSLDFQQAIETARQLVAGAARHPQACLLLGRLNRSNDYTFRHSVSVALVLGVFARDQRCPESEIESLTLGAVLHDVGKMKVPPDILNKPSTLAPAEMRVMHTHVAAGMRLVRETEDFLDPIAFKVLAEHHERYDGTGYPHGLRGEAISPGGRMAGIIDVYDAITADRVYRRAINPAEAVRKLFEWSERHFDRALAHAFIKTVGIFPAGSLVRLASGRLGIVLRQGESSLMMPVVRIIYDTRRLCFVTPVDVALDQGSDRIVGHEAPDRWNIPLERFLD